MPYRSPPNMFFTRQLQVLTVTFSCTVILVSSVGLPLPTIATKDGSKPFPCLKRACGCQTADDCWKKCCCFTDDEKLAWARENGVTPPDEVVARVAARKGSSTPKNVVESGSCCHHSQTCCEKETNREPEPGCCHSKKSVAGNDSSKEIRYVVAMQAARCGGIDLSWLCVKIGITPPAPVDMPKTTNGLVTWFTVLDIEADSRPPEPVILPPRLTSLA